MPKDSGRVNSLSIIFDSYKENSIKQMMQLERAGGEIGRDVYITNMKQKTPQNAHSYPIINSRRRKDMAFVFNKNARVTKQQSC